jgi:hypothetical protein
LGLVLKELLPKPSLPLLSVLRLLQRLDHPAKPHGALWLRLRLREPLPKPNLLLVSVPKLLQRLDHPVKSHERLGPSLRLKEALPKLVRRRRKFPVLKPRHWLLIVAA